MKRDIICKVCLLSAVVLSSCKGFLDEDPKASYNLDDFRTEADARKGLNGVYRNLGSGSVVGTTIKNVTVDLYKRNTFSGENGLIDYSFNSDNVTFQSMWTAHYGVIKDCNVLIDNILTNEDNIDDIEWYIAQARGIRAYMYFDLVRWFGDVPLVLKAYKQLDVEAMTIPRTPQAEVFKQIIDDYEYCIKYSMKKDDTGNGYQYGRMTVEAAQGLLAKVYLWMATISKRDRNEMLGNSLENYRKCMNLCREVITSGKYQLTPYYPDVFSEYTKEAAREEVLMCTEGMRGPNTSTITGMSFGMYGDATQGGSWNTIISTDYHRSIYEPSDSVRKLWNSPRGQVLENGYLYSWDYQRYWNPPSAPRSLYEVAFETHGMNFSCGKFRRFPVRNLETYGQNSGMDEPLLRYADVLLMYAEAYNEVNGGPGTYSGVAANDFTGNENMSAYDAVNLVRKRARIANHGDIHEDLLPRVLNMSLIDHHMNCVPDWRPGFYGYDYSGQINVYELREYSSDYEAFLGELLFERGRELVAETSDRWCDLVRWGKLISQIQLLRTYFNPVLYRFERDIPEPGAPENIKPHMILFPIPQAAIDANRKLTQNPDY